MTRPIPSGGFNLTDCATTRCGNGTHPVYDPINKKCPCQADEILPTPGQCGNLRCKPNAHPVWRPELDRCSCAPGAPPPPDCTLQIMCGTGSQPAYDDSTQSCICSVTNPIPDSCPLLNCISGTHVVYHPETKRCSCDAECPDLFCIATTTPAFNQTTNVCFCDPIPVEGDPVEQASGRDPNFCPTPVCIPPMTFRTFDPITNRTCFC